MAPNHSLRGVFPAIVTPFGADGKFSSQNFTRHINALAAEGCNGVVVLGTTGEGPSLGLGERKMVIDSALESAGSLTVIAGTGCASLTDTIELSRHAFAAGVTAVLVVPPFYFKNITTAGLLAYYRCLLDDAVPGDRFLLLYHIPQVTGVPISFELLAELIRVAPERVAGVKDSSGDFEHLQALCEQFSELAIFAGTDRYLLRGLELGAAGCITAGANVLGALNAGVYDAFSHAENNASSLQEQLTTARAVLEQYMPFAPSIKFLLSERYGTPGWDVRPPLVPLAQAGRHKLREKWAELDLKPG
jgi:4-hydroxy-tetrahydrodipicolinate synthase